MPRADRHFFPLVRVNSDRLLDDVAIAIGNTDGDREVLLLRRASFELGGQRKVHWVRLGDHHHAACVAIEPMDNSRPSWPAYAAELPKVIREARSPMCLTNGRGLDERPCPAAC